MSSLNTSAVHQSDALTFDVEDTGRHISLNTTM